MAIIDSRADGAAKPSYTKSLLDAGTERAAKKFGEEAVEAVIAAVQNDKNALVSEAADVFYHLLVVLKSRKIALEAVMEELERRTSQSGLEEKTSRQGNKQA